MLFRIYLRVVGPEGAIRSFHSDASMPQSSVGALRREAVWPPTGSGEPSWQWQTKFAEAQPATVEGTITECLNASTALAPLIKKYRTSLALASLVIVAECADGEVPGGLYFSSKAISAIHELGVDIDMDFVRTG